MVRDREPVSLVADLLEQVERLRVARDAHRLRLTREVDLLEALGQRRHADVFEAEVLEHARRDPELTLAAVDEEQVRRVREPLAGARTFVAFREVAAEPPGQRLLHRGEVVLARLMTDLEPAVVGPLRQPVFHHHHRRDDVGALEVRDVEALDAQRRFGKVQRVLQREQRARTRVVVGGAAQLVPDERLLGVLGDRLQQLALGAALRARGCRRLARRAAVRNSS